MNTDFTTLKEILNLTGFDHVELYNPFEFLKDEEDDYSKAYLPHLDFKT